MKLQENACQFSDRVSFFISVLANIQPQTAAPISGMVAWWREMGIRRNLCSNTLGKASRLCDGRGQALA
jgi:hypothetical protein